MTQPINERPFEAPARSTTVRTLPVESTLHAENEPLPKLKIWASYPDGSSPESVEVVYDIAGDVPVSFVTGVLRALERPAGPPQFHIEVNNPPASAKEIHTAVNRATAVAPAFPKGQS
jgi:hypothetical protein